MEEREAYEKLRFQHRKEVQVAKRVARENLVQAGIAGIRQEDSTRTGGSSFRKAMMDRARALDQAVNTYKSKVGRTILYSNPTNQRQLETSLNKVTMDAKTVRTRLNHNMRLHEDENFAVLTLPITKLTRGIDYLSPVSAQLRQHEGGTVSSSAPLSRERVSRHKSRRPSLTMDIVDQRIEPVYRLHPQKRILKRVGSADSTVLRAKLISDERECLDARAVKDERFSALIKLLIPGQNEERMKLLQSGIPVIESTDGMRQRGQAIASRTDSAMERRREGLLKRYPYKKEFLATCASKP